MRNSSLAEQVCAENVTRLKLSTETEDSRKRMVEECSIYDEVISTRYGGVYRSKNVGMSND